MAKADTGKNTVVTQGFIDKLIDKISNILKEQQSLKEIDTEQAEEIESLLDKISSIERDFEELTKSLAQGSYPLKLARSIKVAPVSIKPQIVPITIAKSQLISTYNEIPSLLSGYITTVSLTPDSYRSESNGIILETTVKGNYWAIATQQNKQYKYWLLPNSNINFDVHKLKTVANLFQLQGDYNSPNSNFILQEPAVLSLLPNNKHWKLLQPGVLLFGNNLKSSQIKDSHNTINKEQAKINQQVLNSLTAFKTTVDGLNRKINQLEIQSEVSQKAYEQERQEWLLEKQGLSRQIENTSKSKKHLSNLKTEGIDSESLEKERQERLLYKAMIERELQAILAPSNNTVVKGSTNKDKVINNAKNIKGDRYSEKTTTIRNKTDDEDTKIELKTKISRFRRDYTQDLKLISDFMVAKVTISVDTLAQITFYKPDVIVLENSSHGKYWVIDYLDSYFLIPSEIHHITKAQETSLTVAKLLFDLSGYYPQYSSHRLIKPAVVTRLSANKWQLKQKGKFDFS